MKYWKRKDSNRVIGVKEIVQMCSCWIEISKEEFEEFAKLRGK
jgi:hypothetical protein